MWLLQLCYSHLEGVPGRTPGSLFHSSDSSLREPSISQGVLSQSTLSCVGKGTTCRWLPPEAKTRVLSLLTPLNPCFSHPSLQSPKEERLEHRSLTSHTFKLSPLFPLSSFLFLELKHKLLLTLSSPIKEHHPMAQLSFCGRILSTASLAGFLFIPK